MPVENEKRAYPRYELLAQVQVSRDSEVHIMSAEKISRGGIFIQGEPEDYPELTVGTQVEVVVFDADAPGQGDVNLAAKVVRVENQQRAARQMGFGLQFTDISTYDSGTLEGLLQRLKTADA